MNSAELLIQCLENENVKVIFGLPGEENMDVMDALLDSNIQFIQTRHEQAAAFMADVLGRISDKPGVCLGTLGPGATNLITGIANANMDHSPVVAITGQAGIDRMHKESHQYIDLISLFAPITKWNAQIKTPVIIPEVISKAFNFSQLEKRGATHIDFPEDIASLSIQKPSPPIPVQKISYPYPNIEHVKQAAQLISQSKSPIILAGNGVVRLKAHQSLSNFAQKQNISVANTFMAKGIMDYQNPLSLSCIGLQAPDYVSCGFDQADLVIAIGYDIVEYHPNMWNPKRDKSIIHIDVNPPEIDSHYPVKLSLIGDISQTLDMINSYASPHDSNYSRTLHPLILDELYRYSEDTNFPLKPQKIIHDIRSVMKDDDIVISDVGAHKVWISRLYPCSKPNTCLIYNGFASMGGALPGAIALKWLYPNKKIIAISGDGGFMMNSQEIETAIRMNLPFVNLVFNDKTYGLIEWKQINKFKRASHINFNNPDFVKYAESFGAFGYRVKSTDELLPILKDALNQKTVTIIDCPVDFKENLRLTSQFNDLVCPSPSS